MATVPPASPAGAPPSQKSNVLKWVLIGIGAFFALIVIAVVGLGLFVANKARQAGIDPGLIKRNPTLAAARMMVAANPDVEMVSADEGRQEITVRDKKSGKTYTVSFEDARDGKFVMKEDGGKSSLTVGGVAKIPAWVPDYPGSDPQGAFATRGQGAESGTFTFKTKDSSDKVVKYYDDQLKSSGMTVTSNITNQNGAESAGMLSAEDEAKHHSVIVIVGVEGNETTVAVTYATHK
jgi:hypothetical protein